MSGATKATHTRLRTWLLVGVVVSALSGGRFNVAALGWAASVPWLVFMRRASVGWRDTAVLLLALEGGATLASIKVFTGIFPWTFAPLAPLFALPSVFILGVSLLLFERLRRVLGDTWGLAIFPSLSVAVEWIARPVLATSWTWGSLAYTQIDDLALLQVASLFGLGGISFLVAASSAIIAVLVDNHNQLDQHLAMAVAIGSLVIAAQAWGAWRLDQSMAPGPTVTVAAVGSDLDVMNLLKGEELNQGQIDRAEAILFERTLNATKAGAQLVVWNEVATITLNPESEEILLDRGKKIAREHDVDIVMGYAIPLDGLRKFHNKYVWMGPEGAVDTYHKHNPTPGENSLPGVEPFLVLRRPWGSAAGAICYDYDFPSIGLAHARGGAGLAAVPASDWKGIDPYHTKMASVRGIEGGFSVVRSVRTGTSGAYDPLGRTLATSSWFGDGRRIMVARVPVTPVPTLYSKVGDAFPCACFGLVVVAAGLAAIRWRRIGLDSRKQTKLSKAKAA